MQLPLFSESVPHPNREYAPPPSPAGAGNSNQASLVHLSVADAFVGQQRALCGSLDFMGRGREAVRGQIGSIRCGPPPRGPKETQDFPF